MNTLGHCFLYEMIDLGYVQPEAVPDVAQEPVRVRNRHMDADGCRFTLKLVRAIARNRRSSRSERVKIR
jgi:hypothetical protein